MLIDFRKLIAHRSHDRRLIATFAAAVFAIYASRGHCKDDEVPKLNKADVGMEE